MERAGTYLVAADGARLEVRLDVAGVQKGWERRRGVWRRGEVLWRRGAVVGHSGSATHPTPRLAAEAEEGAAGLTNGPCAGRGGRRRWSWNRRWKFMGGGGASVTARTACSSPIFLTLWALRGSALGAAFLSGSERRWPFRLGSSALERVAGAGRGGGAKEIIEAQDVHEQSGAGVRPQRPEAKKWLRVWVAAGGV